MIIGLTGAHRTGKTTLATSYCNEESAFGRHFLPSKASQIFRKMKLDPKQKMSFDIRMDLQERILRAHTKDYEQATSMEAVYITDRTPLDFLAYTIADMNSAEITNAQNDRLTEYFKKCIEVTTRHFDLLVLLQPSIALKDEDGKASALSMPVHNIDMLIRSLLYHQLPSVGAHVKTYALPENLQGEKARLTWFSTIVVMHIVESSEAA